MFNTEKFFKKENNDKTPENMMELASNIVNEAEKIEIKENDRNKEGELLVSPNGPVSNLGKQSELWWKIARTESFKKFFGDWQKDSKLSSKIVDQNGEPLVLFRGVQTGFSFEDFYDKEKYKKEKYQKAEHKFGEGIYFTPIPKIAHSYKSAQGAVFPAFVNARKPKYAGTFFGGLKNTGQELFNMLIPEKLMKAISKVSPIGYDSVFGENNNHNKLFTKEVGEVLEVKLKDPNQVLIIPNTLTKLIKPVAKYANDPSNPFWE